MNINSETQKKINLFAAEQSKHYVDEANMTYLEKLRRKGQSAAGKVTAKLAKFQMSSQQGKEATDDIALLMNDYIQDLLAQGVGEEEALTQAEEAFRFQGQSGNETNPWSGLNEKYQQYYQQYDPAMMEASGLYYGGSVLIGLTLGGITGMLLGVYVFTAPIWIPIVVGAAGGTFLGVGVGMILNASLLRKRIK